MLRSRLRSRRRRVGDYRLHKRIYSQNVIPLNPLSEHNFTKTTWNFYSFNGVANGSPFATSSNDPFNLTTFGFYLGREQVERFPSLIPLGGLSPPSCGPVLPANDFERVDVEQNMSDGGASGAYMTPDKKRRYGAEVGSGASTTPGIGELPGSAADGINPGMQLIGGSRFFRLGKTKIQVKIEMNPPRDMINFAANTDTHIDTQQKKLEHTNMPIEFRMITFKPRRVTMDKSVAPSTSVKADKFDDVGLTTNYFPFANWRKTLFLGSDGVMFGPDNAQYTTFEKIKRYGARILNAGCSLTQAAANYFPMIQTAATAGAFTIASNTFSPTNDQQEAIGKTALLALFQAPVNRKHFKVLEDKRFTLSPPQASAATFPGWANNANKENASVMMMAGHDPRKPQTKNLRFLIPHNRKVDMLQPQTAQAGYATVFFARPIALDGKPDNFDFSLRGYTTYVDHYEDS